MPNIRPERVTARIEGPFVVFLIGMRVNSWWRIHKWLPVFLAMPRMLKELDKHPDAGCLGYFGAGLTVVQYWRSFEHLEAYARDKDHKHWPAWLAFNRRMARCRGAVGIWHETYLVQAGQYEAVYSGMPPHGLGKFGQVEPLGAKSEEARQRLGATPAAA
jgi:hypothetical protein